MKNGYVDYRTLARAFDAVLNNDIMSKTEAAGVGYWEQESGFVDNSEELEELENKISSLFLEVETLEEITEERKNGISENFNDSLSKNLTAKKEELEELEEKKEELENEQDYQPEIFQFYIVSDPGAEILKEFNEIVFYNSEIDVYLWGVTHWGTSWDYVLTDIKIDPAALKED